MKTVRQTGVWIVAFICAFAAQAFGAIDLTISGASSNYFGTIFTRVEPQPPGKFVPIGTRDGKNDRENEGRGHASSRWGRFHDFENERNRPGQLVELKDLAQTDIGGVSYFTFKFELENLGNARKEQITLDSLKIYTLSTDCRWSSRWDSNGTLRYNLDAHGNTSILLETKNSSPQCGNIDMWALIPTSAFGDAHPRDVIKLSYQISVDGCAPKQVRSRWEAEVACHPVIPEPNTVTLVGTGLFAALALLRRRRS